MDDNLTIPVPLEPLTEDIDNRRLWIGNLDPRVTEVFFSYWFVLLKLLQKHGSIENFDLLFHRSGPLQGQPRGYAFVTYTNADFAKVALEKLNGKVVGNKVLSVRWAHAVKKDEYMDKPKIVPDIPALVGTKNKRKISKISAIQAIEAKLKTMEATANSLEFEITNKPCTSTANPVFQLNQPKKKEFFRHKTSPYFKPRCK